MGKRQLWPQIEYETLTRVFEVVGFFALAGILTIVASLTAVVLRQSWGLKLLMIGIGLLIGALSGF